MNEEEIYKKIEDTYNSEKGKNFITHLLRSFLPVNKSMRMLTNDRKLKLVDCITGHELTDVDEHFRILKDEGFEAFMDDMKASAKAVVNGEDTYELPESMKTLRSKTKPIAITCEKSDKVMSEETLNQLFNFYASELIKGNKHIIWIANNERGKEFIKQGKKRGYIENKREERVVKKAVEHAKMSLGDLSVLQELKNKMENE